MRQTYELINNRQATPQRLHALVRLVARLDGPDRTTLANYLQPTILVNNQNAFDVVFRAAVNCGLIFEVDGHVNIDEQLSANGDLNSVSAFRRVMQKRLLGISDPDMDNYLLNILAAWWAVQDTQIFELNSKKEIEIQFNQQLFPREVESGIESGRTINTTKLNHWLEWAGFLGWGWTYQGMLMPNAQLRIELVLAELVGKTMPFGAFMSKLAENCPELDGGILFKRAWQVSQGGQHRGQKLSLMLSTALRVLNDEGMISLVRRADAPDIWRLHEAEGYGQEEVSDIEFRG